MFYAVLFRFFWGLLALMGSLWTAQWSMPWTMLNRNHSVCALAFDVSGVMILIGIVFYLMRAVSGHSTPASELPKSHWAPLCLIGAIVLSGFTLEGMRIAMTGSPHGSEYAFVGYGISRILARFSGLVDVYGYLWYLHAVVVGIFAACLPFSRMLHIIIAPAVFAMDRSSPSLRPLKK
jgi:nitrate reductase gamma subunit